MHKKFAHLTSMLFTLFFGVALIFVTSYVNENKESPNVNFYKTGNYSLNVDYLKFGFDHSVRKITQKDSLGTMTGYTVYLAKNEYEGCQIAFNSDIDISSVIAEVGNFTDKNGNSIEAEIFREYYIPTRKDLYPDPIVPLTEVFDVKADENFIFYIRLRTKSESIAGNYKGNVTLKSGENVLFTGEINAVVWDFTLPEVSSCETLIGIFGTKTYDSGSSYKEYYDFLLDYKICGYNLPYGIMSDEVDAYLNNPRVTSFKINYTEKTTADTIKMYYEKLSSNPEWLKKVYFYPMDEPNDIFAYDKLYKVCIDIRASFPNARIVCPFFVSPKDTKITNDTGHNVSFAEYYNGYMSIWCSKPSNYYQDSETFSDILNKGNELWWYVCWEPREPYGNLLLDMQTIVHRELFWQQKIYNVDGFLYWGANFWSLLTANPWESMQTVPQLGSDIYGDGSLLYPGAYIGDPGPVASIRLEAVRDGVEDFDYLTILEQQKGNKFMMKFVNKIATTAEDANEDFDVFAQTRIKLGNMIEKNTK